MRFFYVLTSLLMLVVCSTSWAKLFNLSILFSFLALFCVGVIYCEKTGGLK